MDRARMKKPDMRATAAWAMGKMAQDRFIAPLTELVRDEQPSVRSVALRSLLALRRMEPITVRMPEAEAVEILELVEVGSAGGNAAVTFFPAEEIPDFALSLNGLSYAIGKR
jgi:hypothetical protein